MQEYNSIYNKIYNHPLLNSTINELMLNEFAKDNFIRTSSIEISDVNIRKVVWLSSILASSDNELDKSKAYLLASLLFLNYSKEPSYLKAAYIIFSRTGNLTSTKFLKELYSSSEDGNLIFNQSFDSILDWEVIRTRHEHTIEVGYESYLTTDFQKKLWNTLIREENVSISAPTSSGKSFIIKKYIKDQISKKRKYNVLYVVPSRALLSQVSEEFRSELKDSNINIRTAFLKEDFDEENNNLYILTAERCLKLLEEGWTKELNICLIFIDEIQNVEDEQGRGNLLEYILKELILLFKRAKVISAGPFLRKPEELYKKLFGVQGHPVESSSSPVFQIKTIIRPESSNTLKLIVKGLDDTEFSLSVNTKFNFRHKIQKNIGDGLPDILNLFGKRDQNLIYAPRTDYVENWALKFSSKSFYKEKEINKRIKELIEFLEDEIHPKYYLIKCLNQSSAFHHSRLPDIVRKEIEDLFLEKKIKNLFCTSTLLEGVNLPANNLFIVIPKKKDERLSAFEFGNLIGRAGRFNENLYGTIYSVERNEEEGWASQYYESSYEKDVNAASDKSLEKFEGLLENISKPIEELEGQKNLNTVILFRQKFLKDPKEFSKYLEDKNLSVPQIQKITTKLNRALKNISIPREIVRLNPSIDPLLQNELYLQIKRSGPEKWVIIPNPNFHKRIKKERVTEYNFENLSLFWQLEEILSRLDKIFKLQREAFIKHSISLSIPQMAAYGLQWLESLSYSELIKRDLSFNARHMNPSKRIDPNNEEDVNKRINEIIKINSTLVSYILVKYLKLLYDITAHFLNEEQREKYKFSLAIPTMMELGTSEPVVMQLISRGVSRSVALKIFHEFKKVKDFENVDVFAWLAEKRRLNVKPIYNRYLKKLNLLQIEKE